MRFLRIAFFLSLVLAAPDAYAACTSPTGVSGSINYDNTTKQSTICDGTTWKIVSDIDYTATGGSINIQIANDTGSCSADKTGRIRYDSAATFEYCNGTAWTSFSRNVPRRGYLVQTNTTFNGNLGGLAGANTKCYTDLTTYDWRGKTAAGTLTAARVKALLCDGTTCNNLEPSTTYMMSRSGDAIAGGVTLLTDSTGRGPNNQIYFDPADKIWRGATNYWMNRSTVSAQVWGLTPKGSSNASHCTNWSSTSSTGNKGNSGAFTASRWDDTTSTCSTTNYLICIVSP